MRNSTTTWADVAHMYLQSPTQIWIGALGMETVISLKDWYVGRREDGIEVCVVKPILRHLEDLTTKEKKPLFALAGPSEVPHDWVLRIWWLKEYSPNEFLWLLSNGFDMFGLIESGQAIRKGVGNG